MFIETLMENQLLLKLNVQLPTPLTIDGISVMLAWRLREKIIGTVLFCIVYDSYAQWYTRVQFLQLTAAVGIVLFFVFLV